MKYNFFMSLRTQYENLGDYFIAQATIDILNSLGDITIDVRNVPQNYIDLFDFPTNCLLIKTGFVSTIILNNKKKWVYIVKPGGYTTSKTIKSKIKIIMMYFYFLSCKIFFNIKLIKMPHSYLGKLSMVDKSYQKLFDLNIVRDKLSLENYKKNTIENTVLLEDLAIYYIGINSKFLSKKKLERNKITISLRFDRQENEGEISYAIAKLLMQTEKLNEINYVSQVTFDSELNHTFSSLNKRKHLSYELTNESINKIIDIYKSSKYIISNRLHALLLAKINGAIPIPIIDIEKDKKIIGSLDLLNIQWLDKNTLDVLNYESLLLSLIKNNKKKNNIKYKFFLNEILMNIENKGLI